MTLFALRQIDDASFLKLDGSIHHGVKPMHLKHEGIISERGSFVRQAQSNIHRRKADARKLAGHDDGNEPRETLVNAAVAPPTPPEATTRSHAMVPVYTKADLFLVTLALLAMLVMFACCAWIGCCMHSTDDSNDLTASEQNLVGRSWDRSNLDLLSSLQPP